MKRKFYFFLLACLTFSLAQAQQKKETALGSAYGGFLYGQPIGEFAKNYSTMRAAGFTFGFMMNPKPGRVPLELGLEVNYMNYGVDRERVNLPQETYILRTSHQIIPLHGVVRLKPHWHTQVVPYLDGLAGISIFDTRTKLKDDEWATDDEDPIVMDKHTRTVFSYGIGGGLLFKLAKNAYADLRLVYLERPLTTYIKDNRVSVGSDGYPVYQFSRSETSMLHVQLNVVGIITRH